MTRSATSGDYGTKVLASVPRGTVSVPWLRQPLFSGDLADTRVRGQLASALRALDAPDVVLGYSREGRRVLCATGTGPSPDRPREELRYETGSATKTFTTLLLAELHHTGALSWSDPVARYLAPHVPVGPRPITFLHLATHTAGLPRLPHDFYPQALPRWNTNPYAGYSPERLRDVFVRDYLLRSPRHAPGTRWRYSNFGVSVLGHAMAAALSTSEEELLRTHVLGPLGLTNTSTRPEGPPLDAVGRRGDGLTPVPPLRMGGFTGAGAVRSTPHDLLRYLEAQSRTADGPLSQALRATQQPVLRRGLGHRHTHTLSWFWHDTAFGPVYFHSGATCGQQAFLGFRPETNTAVVALCTRRYRPSDTFIATAYGLLTAEP